jgi:cell division protein FtsI/penicillin-binding protein 2
VHTTHICFSFLFLLFFLFLRLTHDVVVEHDQKQY